MQRGWLPAAVLTLVAGPGLAAEASLFGTTGLLQSPSAGILNEGSASVAASHHNPAPGVLETSNVYSVGLGFWQDFEVVGRLAAGSPGPESRDLSGDLRYRFLAFDNGPSFAAGLQDYGGQTDNFRTRYLVGTWPWRSLSATLGYGERGTALDGWFGGAQWRPSSYFGLVVDHANRETLGGVRLSSGSWFGELRASLTVSYASRRHETDFGLALNFPLGSRPRRPAPVTPESLVAPAEVPDLSGLAESYRQAGFEAVRVGTRPDGSVVAVAENRTYNHSQADAVGVAFDRASRHLPPSQSFELVLTRHEVPQLAVRLPMQDWNGLVSGDRDGGSSTAWVRAVNEVPESSQVQWQAPREPLRSIEIIGEPVLRTFIGTEFGVVDLGLGVRLTAVIPLAPGLLGNLSAKAPVAETDDFRDGRNFSGLTPRAGVDRALFQYFHKPHPTWSWLWSAGKTSVIETQARVAALEQVWLPGSGRHQLNLKLMQLWTTTRSAGVALGGYTWFDPARNYAVTVTGGRFYAGDNGGRLELNRYFGDTLAGFFWKFADRDNQMVGVQVSLPLTPRRDMAPGLVQIKGTRRWRYSLGTTVNHPSGANPLRPLLLYEPALTLDLRRDFLDAGRLTPAYLGAHSGRMLDAAAAFPPP